MWIGVWFCKCDRAEDWRFGVFADMQFTDAEILCTDWWPHPDDKDLEPIGFGLTKW